MARLGDPRLRRLWLCTLHFPMEFLQLTLSSLPWSATMESNLGIANLQEGSKVDTQLSWLGPAIPLDMNLAALCLHKDQSDSTLLNKDNKAQHYGHSMHPNASCIRYLSHVKSLPASQCERGSRGLENFELRRSTCSSWPVMRRSRRVEKRSAVGSICTPPIEPGFARCHCPVSHAGEWLKLA